ncbi:hypothetical protein KY084_09770 [Stakelama sp. CBK3Z-3]|uniref:DUF2157 domain-containing protein n=1 Tax=Stakelama flava TaxID=2860338 RepID=A0ABS6XLS5_9SPHN|nr:hypothetical protein [Stakelama flava]MBW4331157.1 hypothetical protein [Stakelama flava]
MAEEMMRDLARLRELAEEGRRLPLLGGRILILWGAVIAAAALLQGAVLAGWLDWPPISFALIWFGLTGAAALLSRRFVGRGRGAGYDLANRIERAVWRTGGTFLGTLAIAIFVTATLRMQAGQGGDFYRMFAMLPPVMFGVYALALRTAAVASAQRMLEPYIWLSLLFALLSVVLGWTIWQFPVTALGVLIVSVVPGITLVRIEAGGRG